MSSTMLYSTVSETIKVLEVVEGYDKIGSVCTVLDFFILFFIGTEFCLGFDTIGSEEYLLLVDTSIASFSSYVGRINYDFNQKYLLSGIVRRDGTSKLLEENRWKVYPSVSAGWLISD